MKLSDGEKLIVMMLTEIYDKLGVDGELDAEFIRAAIFEDALWSMSWKYPGIQFEHDETPEIVKEVIDILDMWSLIELSYKRLSEEDKSILAESLPSYRIPPTFKGFDGNNESDHLASSHFIINRLNRFTEFKGRELNSHIHSLVRYRKMLRELETLPRSNDYSLLSVESLAKIITIE